MAMSAYNLFVFSGPVADTCLIAVLLRKGRAKVFPLFTALVIFDLISTLIFVFFRTLGSNRTVYGVLDAISVALQIAVVLELLRHLIPREDQLGLKARAIFRYLSLAGLSIAAVVAAILNPPGISGPALYELRADIFTGLVVCETVIAIMIAAQQVGLGWRNHLIAIAQGLMVWALLLVAVEGFGPYLNFHNAVYNKLYYVRSITYLGTLAYWSVALWREEPARKPISPALRKYIVALHDQVQYDLGKTGN